jgi:hypothetical protein
MAYTTIDDPAQYFNTVLYTGNGSDDRSISGVGFQPNFLWVKERSATSGHIIVDSIRGATKFIQSHNTTAEDTNADIIQAFESDGFQIGTHGAINENSQTYVAWNWKEDTTAGFDIVSYTGNSSDGTTVQDVSHSLSAVPHWIIVKNRTDSTNWAVYHKGNTSAPETEVIYLNATNATSDDSAFFGDTAPTSSQFRVGGDNGVNGNSDAMIAYVWSEKKGFSKFGSYTGNGNADGTFIYTGFKPAWIMIKQSSTSGAGWRMHDTKRGISGNPEDETLYASANNAESTGRDVDFLSNGFKLRTDAGDGNSSGATYIYMAFAESPFVNSNGIPTNAR